MKKIVLTTIAAIMVSGAANAGFTIKSGQVLNTELGVIDAVDSPITQQQIANEGYAVSGGQVHVEVNDQIVSVDINEFRNAQQHQYSDIIGVAAVEQGAIDLPDHVADAIVDAGGLDAYNAKALADAGLPTLDELGDKAAKVAAQGFTVEDGTRFDYGDFASMDAHMHAQEIANGNAFNGDMHYGDTDTGGCHGGCN